MMRVVRRRLLVTGAFVIVLAACGSSGGANGARASSPTASPAAADPGVVAAGRVAAAGRIRRADLPGWKATLRTPLARTDMKTIAAGLPACASYVAGIRDGL